MRATKLLNDLDQSLWLDNITRDLLDSGNSMTLGIFQSTGEARTCSAKREFRFS
jgi:hypothetical protein